MAEDAFSKFCNLSEDEMVAWVGRVMNYATNPAEIPSETLAPLEYCAWDRAAETIVSPFAEELQNLPSQSLQKFHRAFAKYVEKTTSEDPKAWEAMGEMAWRLEISMAVPAFEKQLQAKHIETLGFLPRQADNLLGYIRNIPASNANEVAAQTSLLHYFVESQCIDDSQARLTLWHLCQLDPDHWTGHVTCTRSLLDKQMQRILGSQGEDGLRKFQNNVAGDIFQLIGFERLSEGLPDVAVDEWLLTSLERTSKIKHHGSEIIEGDAKLGRRL